MILRIILPLSLIAATVVVTLSGFHLAGKNIDIDNKAKIASKKALYLHNMNQPVDAVGHIFQMINIRAKKLSLTDKCDLAEAIASAAKEFGQEPMLLLAVIEIESGFRREVVSNKGAVGLMQLRPFVAEAMADEIGMPYKRELTLVSIDDNVRLGSHYLSKLYKRFNGNLMMTLEAYNQGPTRLSGKIEAGITPKWTYTTKILRAHKRFKRLGRTA